ncbi:MAG: RsiV family protein [Leadbetterella sp.]|nr:RsiV family protein [Leadbetterella sp.]
MRYRYDMEFERLSADSLGVITYLFTTYEYTGGANGNSLVNSYSFNANSRRVVIEDILDLSGHRDVKLSRLLAERALSDTTLFFKDFVESGLGLAYLKADGVTLDREKCRCDGFSFASNFENFVVEDKGITFYFHKYAIAPGAAGITRISLSWENLRPYLKNPLPF